MEKLDQISSSDTSENGDYDLVMKHVIQDDPELFYLDSFLLNLFSLHDYKEVAVEAKSP